MAECVEERQIGGLFARVYLDESGYEYNPRQENENLGTISWWGSFDSRMGDLSDERVSLRDCPFCETWTMTDAEHCPVCGGAGELSPSFGDDVVIPLDVFEDWAPSLRFEDSLTDARGAIHVSREKVAEEYGTFSPANAKRAKRVLRAEVEEYAAYLRGEVYFWRVETADGETLDAVHGYVGDPAYVLSEAVDTAEYHVEGIAAESRESSYWAARDVVTV